MLKITDNDNLLQYSTSKNEDMRYHECLYAKSLNVDHIQRENPHKSCASVRRATMLDCDKILKLYKAVILAYPGYMNHSIDEITLDYVKETTQLATKLGCCLVLEKDENIIGYIKAFTSKLSSLCHILSNVTVIIMPKSGAAGYGVKLLNALLHVVMHQMQHISIIEAFPRGRNKLAISLYMKFGCKVQTIVKDKIFIAEDQSFDDEVHVIWRNQNFCQNALAKYRSYLNELN